MRVDLVDGSEGPDPAMVFPPSGDFLDLRENPTAVERIAAARRYMALRNFLVAVNGAESLFATAIATTKSDLAAAASIGRAYEFASQTSLVFAEPAFNFERERYAELRAGMKNLLERDSGNAVRVVLRICSCDFTAHNRRGFCLGIRLEAQGDSVEQAEMRWGLALARVQQALLFRARALRQQAGD